MSGASTSDALGGLARIYDAVLSMLGGVSFPIVEMATWDAIEEFCARSWIWRQTLQWVLEIDETHLDFNPVDEQTRAVWVLRVTGLRQYRLLPPATLVDYGSFDTQRRGTALVVCKPARLSAYGTPSFLLDEWSEALREGALARLLLMPKKPWSDAKLAQYFGNRFRSAIFRAKETVRGDGDLPRPAFPYFARGHQRGYGLYGDLQFSFMGGPPLGDQTLANSPIPINNGEAADIDDGLFTDPPLFGDFDGGKF